MEKVIKHLPLILSILAIVLVFSVKGGSGKSHKSCQSCQRNARFEQGLRSRLGAVSDERREEWGKKIKEFRQRNKSESN